MQLGTDFRHRNQPSTATSHTEMIMALFMIERNFAAALNLSAGISGHRRYQQPCRRQMAAVVSVSDKRKTYCLYEAESGDAIREAAGRAGLPADIVIELAGQLRPEVLLAS